MHLLSGFALLAFGCCSLALPLATTTQPAPATPTSFYPFQIYPLFISNWQYFGCFSEGSRGRALDGPSLTNYTFMSESLCGSFCGSFKEDQSYQLFGVENGGECYCGNSLSVEANPIPSGGCTDWCPVQYLQYRGQPNATCGGKEQLSVFSNHGYAPAYPSIIPSAGNYSYVGCFTDTTQSTLIGGRLASFNMTLDTCAAYCSQWMLYTSTITYKIFGLQQGTEVYCSMLCMDDYESNVYIQCYCGDAIEPGTALAPDSECEAMTCSGNATEYCGGTNRLSTYVLPGTYVPY